MKTRLEHILTHAYKADMIAHLTAHHEDFEEAIQLAVADKQPYSWRAAWLLWSCMEENDPRIRDHIRTMIDAIPSKRDGHQRELLKILQQMAIIEEDEGYLFDICVTIWEKINNRPSVRWHAFNTIVGIAKRHPYLFNEINYKNRYQIHLGFFNLNPIIIRLFLKSFKPASPPGYPSIKQIPSVHQNNH